MLFNGFWHTHTQVCRQKHIVVLKLSLSDSFRTTLIFDHICMAEKCMMIWCREFLWNLNIHSCFFKLFAISTINIEIYWNYQESRISLLCNCLFLHPGFSKDKIIDFTTTLSLGDVGGPKNAPLEPNNIHELDLSSGDYIFQGKCEISMLQIQSPTHVKVGQTLNDTLFYFECWIMCWYARVMPLPVQVAKSNLNWILASTGLMIYLSYVYQTERLIVSCCQSFGDCSDGLCLLPSPLAT